MSMGKLEDFCLYVSGIDKTALDYKYRPESAQIFFETKFDWFWTSDTCTSKSRKKK